MRKEAHLYVMPIGGIEKLLTEMEISSEDDRIFPRKKERKEIVEIGKTVCQYVHKEKIKQIILIDRSARPAYITILENWRRLYPKTPPPKINFINPKGFVSLQEIAHQPKSEIRFGRNESYSKDDKVESTKKIRSQKVINKDLRKYYSPLPQSVSHSILLFDTCIHHGETIRPIQKAFQKMGFSVKLGIISPVDNDVYESGIEPDLVVMQKAAARNCYPFERDILVRKTYTSILSLRNRNGEDREFSWQIRQEIRESLNEFYPKINPSHRPKSSR